MSTQIQHGMRAETIGVIGLGAMGEPMVRRLLAEQRAVVITGRSPRPALVTAGATWGQTPRELATGASAVLSMLPDLPQLEEALGGPDGLLAGLADDDELLLLVGSTSSAPAVRALAERLGDETAGRVRVVDCPVSGGVDGAIAGTLSIMLGGRADDSARAAALLAPCGTPVHLGPIGAGEVAKACNQLVVAATITALGEATVLADRSGLDLDALWTLLGGGYAGSNLLASRRDKLVAGDDSPSGIARYMIKDLGFAADIAAATGTSPALLPTLRAFFDEIVERGHGERDITVARRVIAER
ncbi:NAD(P)-dependent oxidoreductase [Agrococcus sp. ARC_14]|uniref:NAD(P)-dependent oxidoreductase n=1 Tax=Agrococcus sp. ARC_14 TaxID=2919927 RepID=UPI001F06BB10|nr:NAD(P)-dependent oxidoreductase [Agrococcus sp. ARC_14]MCH1882366.1 NAD(P)-dependent oxidoreductase [Agrococcus sp. ARC_14]